MRIIGWIALLVYMLTIPLANWLILHVGVMCDAGPPCVVPVWPNVYCPSGSLMIGFALVSRDLVQRILGTGHGLVCIFVGALVSLWFAPPMIALASFCAFLFGELADFFVYTPLQRRRFIFAVFASGIAGLVADSVLFLWLAFGSLDLMAGILLGKFWIIMLTLPVLHASRRHLTPPIEPKPVMVIHGRRAGYPRRW